MAGSAVQAVPIYMIPKEKLVTVPFFNPSAPTQSFRLEGDTDDAYTPLFPATLLAKKLGKPTNTVTTKIWRSIGKVEGIYQASRVLNKQPGSVGRKTGSYFITMKCCLEMEAWFKVQGAKKKRRRAAREENKEEDEEEEEEEEEEEKEERATTSSVDSLSQALQATQLAEGTRYESLVLALRADIATAYELLRQAGKGVLDALAENLRLKMAHTQSHMEVLQLRDEKKKLQEENQRLEAENVVLRRMVNQHIANVTPDLLALLATPETEPIGPLPPPEQ